MKTTTNEGDKWVLDMGRCYFCGEPSKLTYAYEGGSITICGCLECVDLLKQSFNVLPRKEEKEVEK